MKQKDLARALGISPAMVSKLAARGMPTHDLAKAKRWRKRHLSPAHMAARELAAAAAPSTQLQSGDSPPPPDPPDHDDALDDDEHAVAYREHRAVRERIRAEREQLELDERRGLLVDVAEVARLRFTEFRALRDALQNIGARVKDACAVEADPLKVQQLIEAEVDTTLAAFAESVLTRGVTQDDEDEAEGI
jgi:transcriptional regulator with XRE-family HTH domain